MSFTKQHNNYESEITLFIKALKEKNPALEKSQQAGRARWWDSPPADPEQQAREQESRIKQQAYVYETK